MILVVIFCILGGTCILLIVALLMVVVIATTTLHTSMHVFLVYAANVLYILLVEFHLWGVLGGGSDFLEFIKISDGFGVSLLYISRLKQVSKELFDEIEGGRLRDKGIGVYQDNIVGKMSDFLEMVVGKTGVEDEQLNVPFGLTLYDGSQFFWRYFDESPIDFFSQKIVFVAPLPLSAVLHKHYVFVLFFILLILDLYFALLMSKFAYLCIIPVSQKLLELLPLGYGGCQYSGNLLDLLLFNDHLELQRVCLLRLLLLQQCQIFMVQLQWLAFRLFQNRFGLFITLFLLCWLFLCIFFGLLFSLFFFLSLLMFVFGGLGFTIVLDFLHFQVGNNVDHSKNIPLAKRSLVEQIQAQMYFRLITSLQCSCDCIDVWRVFDLVGEKLHGFILGVIDILYDPFVPLELVISDKRTAPEHINIQGFLLILILEVLVKLTHPIDLIVHHPYIIDKPLLLLLFQQIEAIVFHPQLDFV